MNIKEATEQMEGAIEAYLAKDDRGLYLIPFRMQRPIIMLGPLGVGKTAVAEQIADRMGINFVSYSITHHTRQSALGLPFIEYAEFEGREYSVSEYTMSEIIAAVYRAREESGVDEGILFLDEVNCVSETLAPVMLQFLQYKNFGMHQLPEGWVIVTAGNPPEYNRAAREFDPAMLDRLLKIEVEPDVQIWQEYAAAHGVHPTVTTYLETKPASFYNVRASARGSRIVTCRGWEDLSRMIQAYERLGKIPPASMLGRYLQDPEIAEDFSVYYETFRKYRDGYRVEGILDGSFDEGLTRRAQAAGFDERIAVVGLLSDALLQRVHAVVEAEEALKAVRADLLEMKLRLEKSADVSEVIAKKIETIKRAQVNPRDLAGSLGDKEAVKAERLRMLGDVARAVKPGSAEPRGGFELAKRAFNEECLEQASVAKSMVDALDNAFKFLDGAFGEDGQEPLMFISKLAADPLLIRFVSNHGSDEYLKHNESMLFSERGFSLLQEIESMGELL